MIVLPPADIEFSYHDNGKEMHGTLDVLEAGFVIDEIAADQTLSERDQVDRFKQWILEKGHEVSFAGAVVLRKAAMEAAFEFQKKTKLSSESPSTTKSTRKRSAKRPSTSSTEDLESNSPQTNSDKEPSKAKQHQTESND